MQMQDLMRLAADETALRQMVKGLNKSSSNAPPPECSICGDTGMVDVDMPGREGYKYSAPCKCQEAKRARRILDQSGLAEHVGVMTFEAYQAIEDWQKVALASAQEYANKIAAGGKEWFYIGGQVGSGKTHLCTGICGTLLGRGIPVRYMLWQDEVRRIMADTNNADALDELLEPLKSVPVLYVDDLMKGRTGAKPEPSPADLKLAFEIFNARYVRNLPTIISGEHDLSDLNDIDQGTFSRVVHKCRDYKLYITPRREKNWRLK